MPLSVVIVAQDEERTIGRVIEAVKPIADEVVLVDSGSSDKTIEIATSLGARVLHQDWLGYAGQKNFAIDLAKNDWILSLDADEILTPELVAEISEVLNDPNATEYDGYKLPRVLYIGDTPIKHGGFYPDAQLRLIQRGKGRFNDRMVHEAIKVDGPVKMLKNCMLHYAYKDVAGFSAAMEKYAQLSAKEFAKRKKFGWKTHPVNEILHPAWTFLYRYFARGGLLDGALGLKLANIYSDYVRKKIRYLRELEKSDVRS
ncbi:glycosyltransferase family 2 protein [Candidatus Obscuribacterales bacterium]|nr:glycosyltransferase family 2 protein [Candidatus Obscuribacterales bacterium]MBX3152415.1 glycosyltransferase family 2 protein [Candidatus Obscuribacterales bacterium]